MSLNSAPKNKPKELVNYRERFKDKIDDKGFLFIGDFCTSILHRQSKSIASFLDGDGDHNPEINFGEKLSIRYEGNSGNYSDMKIHIDDLEKFIEAVKTYYGE
jgi:hypothetical protein